MKRAAAIIVAALLAATQALAVGGGIGGGQLNDYAWSSDPTILYSPNLSPSGDGGTWNIDPSGGLGGMFIGHSQFSALLAQFMSTNTELVGSSVSSRISALSTNSLRLIQADTQAWVSVANGTATLWRVSTTQTTFMVAATIVNSLDTRFPMTYRGNGRWWDGDTFRGGHSCEASGTNWIFNTPNFGMYWVGANYPILPAQVLLYGDNQNVLTLQASGTDLVSVAVGAAYTITNVAPLQTEAGTLILIADRPTFSQTTSIVSQVAATSEQLTALSNSVFGAWSTAAVSGGVLALDWNAGFFLTAAPTNAAYTVSLTNKPAGPRALTLLLTTPATTVPTITWPTNVVWSSQLDVTSNRVYFISIIWDGGSYAAVPVYSR